MLFYYFWDMNAYFDDYYLTWEVTSTNSISPTDLESYLIWTLMGTSCSMDIISFLKLLYDTVSGTSILRSKQEHFQHVNKTISGLEAQRRVALNKKILFQVCLPLQKIKT